MKYPERKGLNLAAVNQEVLNDWKADKTFQKSIDSRINSEKGRFVFYEGPPSANGNPGIHHVMARTIKDIFCRYKTLQGYLVDRKGGWDTHGLPVELKVEKELGITKEDIGTKISVEEYNAKCRATVMQFKEQWDAVTEKMGYWVDLDNPYVTFEPAYMESLWGLLKKLYDKGLIYKGYTIQPFSPAAGTGLSSHELNLPGCYRDVKDTSITAQFKVLRNERSENLLSDVEGEVFVLAWTTTPWTLPSNAALTVGNHIEYALVQTFNQYTFKPITVILAKDLVGKQFSKKQAEADFNAYKEGDKTIPYKILKTVKGSELTGLQYEQLLPYVTPEGKAFELIPGDFVTTEDGTGIVHTAPTFGADDKRVADLAGISAITVKDELGNEVPLVNKQGRFVQEVTDFAGYPVKEEYLKEGEVQDKSTDVLIAIQLKEANRAFKVEKYVHNYPHCWRTDKPILYYPLDSWFIKTTEYKDRMIELNDTINWKPKSTGVGRFGNWLKNLVDWNLSRSRYWGTPLNIWRTKDTKHEICIGSLDQLKEEIAKSLKAGHMTTEPDWENFDFHRPYVDDLILTAENGEAMYREPDLIDVWFDSGAMPYAQWGYPIKGEESFKSQFPADYISEGVDQTRGWFFTLHALATMLEDKVAYKNVISTGLLLDKEGNKMSKRLGNVIDPFETLNNYGADPVRWYMVENAPPWENFRFDLKGVEEVTRKFFGTLHNTYNFFALYANLDSFDYKQAAVANRPEMDSWILSRLNTLIKEVEAALEDYDPTRTARAIASFTQDDLSNWYVRLNRKRFWKSELGDDKISAYQTLHTCLTTLAKLISPIAPFYAQKLYGDLLGEGTESVHLTDFPTSNDALIDKDLEHRNNLAQRISSLVHSLRKKEKVKVRTPLSKILIPNIDAYTTEQIKLVEPIILSETNIKGIEYLEGDSGIFVKTIKPNFPKLGKLYGKLMKQIGQAIGGFEQSQINQLEQGTAIPISIDGQDISITLDDVEIRTKDIPGWSIATDGTITVALDLTLTDELIQEGFARDLVNRIQNMRKDQGMEIQDKIKIKAKTSSEPVQKALDNFGEYIKVETQAMEVIELAEPTGEEFDLEGEAVSLVIERI